MNTYPDPALEPRPQRDVRVLNFSLERGDAVGAAQTRGPAVHGGCRTKIRCDARPVSAAGTGKEHVDDNADHSDGESRRHP